MIICAPDMTLEVAARFGVEACLIVSLSRSNLDNRDAYKMWRIADVGLAVARTGVFPLARYLTLIKRAKAHWAVVPDVFADFRATLSNWHRYSLVIAKFATPVFVAQEFHRPQVLDTLINQSAKHIALPMRIHPDTPCALRPRLCAERAERALRWLCGNAAHVHLLGPPLRAVKMLRDVLRQCEGQGTLVSFDTAAYRRAPNSSIKKQLGGRWQPNSAEEAEKMLEAWLRQALT